MLTCVTTRFRPATDSHSPYVPLFRESDPRKTRYALASRSTPAAHLRADPLRPHSSPSAPQSAASAPRKIHSIPMHPPAALAA
jgi:hypothetical protein